MPYLPDEPTIAKHEMMIRWGVINELRVLLFSGRFHYYEGNGRVPVMLPLWAARACGIRNFLLVNAAGGIAEELVPGTFMCIEDHINRLGISALMGHHHLLRTPYVDMTEVYCKALRNVSFTVADRLGLPLKRGIYCANCGPQFETPAEIEMLRQAGVSAVGMSTVLEATILHALEANVAGLSLITNRAAGLSKSPLSHEETLAQGRMMENKLGKFLRNWCDEFRQRIESESEA